MQILFSFLTIFLCPVVSLFWQNYLFLYVIIFILAFFHFDGFLAIPPPSLLFATNKTFWTFFSLSKKSQFSWKQRPHKNVALSWLSQSYCMMWEWYLNTMLLKKQILQGILDKSISIYLLYFFWKNGPPSLYSSRWVSFFYLHSFWERFSLDNKSYFLICAILETFLCTILI